MNGVPAYSGAVTNPMMLAAIESTRQHLLTELHSWNKLDAKSLPEHLANKMPVIDDPRMLKRWQADCRGTVLQFEAMAGLLWERIEVSLNSPGKGDGGAFRLQQAAGAPRLITITRPDWPVLARQAARVAERAAERVAPKSEDPSTRDRICEINVQVVPQYAFWSSVLPMHPERMPRTLELMQLALDVAFVVEQRFKHALAVPRPHEINPSVCPALLTPGHGSLPSGHATEAFTIATLMTALLGGSKVGPTLKRLAQRIADNRQVAGLHYAIDTLAGQLLGTVLGDFLVARCRGGEITARRFDGGKLDGDEECYVDGELRTNIAAIQVEDKKVWIEYSEQLCWLWHEARVEWGANPDEDQRTEPASASDATFESTTRTTLS